MGPNLWRESHGPNPIQSVVDRRGEGGGDGAMGGMWVAIAVRFAGVNKKTPSEG